MINKSQYSRDLIKKTKTGKPSKIFFRTRKSEGVRVEKQKQTFARYRKKQASLVDLHKD